MRRITLLVILFGFQAVLFAQNTPREFEIKEGDTTYIMKQYIMCLLKKGPDRNQSEEDAAKIQEGHMNHINKLSEEGKIVVAGPFGDDGELRGILIFDVETITEAEALESADPAIISGRLVMELHPWWTAKGTQFK